MDKIEWTEICIQTCSMGDMSFLIFTFRSPDCVSNMQLVEGLCKDLVEGQ